MLNVSNYNYLNPYQTYKNRNISAQPNFEAASDITLRYLRDKRSQYLPKRVLEEIEHLCTTGQDITMTLPKLHQKIYAALFSAKTMDKVREEYSEFEDVIEITEFAGSRSKALKAIREKKIPLENFTLGYLKDVYTPLTQEDIVAKYGFTNRSLLEWLNEKMNIKKLPGAYITLLKMSDEKENQRIAELSRRAMFANPEVQKYRLEKAAEAHRTQEYREKKRQEMIDFYKRHPEAAEKTRLISKGTWDKCEEMKKAFAEYTKSCSECVRSVLSKKRAGKKLSDAEKRIIDGYYRGYWTAHPEFNELYRQARKETINELFNQV